MLSNKMDNMSNAFMTTMDSIKDLATVVKDLKQQVKDAATSKPAISSGEIESMISNMIGLNKVAPVAPPASPVTDQRQVVQNQQALNQQEIANLRATRIIDGFDTEGNPIKIDLHSLPLALVDKREKQALAQPTAEASIAAFVTGVITDYEQIRKTDTVKSGIADQRQATSWQGETVITPVTDSESKALNALKDAVQQSVDMASLGIDNMYQDPSHCKKYSKARANQTILASGENYYRQRQDPAQVKALIDANSKYLRNSQSLTDAQLTLSPNNLASAAFFSQMVFEQVYQRLVGLGICRGFGPDSQYWKIGENQTKQLADRIGRILTIGVGTSNLNTNNHELYLDESGSIPEQATEITLQNFCVKIRAIGASIGTDLVHALKGGSLPTNIIGRIFRDLAGHMARAIDFSIWKELHGASARYQCVSVTSETLTPGVTDNIIYNGVVNPEIKIEDTVITYGGNAIAIVVPTANMQNPAVTPATLTTPAEISSPGYLYPLVPPSEECGFDRSGLLETIERFPITVSLSGTPLVRGILLPTGDIGSLTENGPTPEYAVDFDNGVIVLAVASGFTGTQTLTLEYSYETNFSNFDIRVPAGILPENHYNGLLNAMGTRRGELAGRSNFMTPDTCITTSQIVHGIIGNASKFHRDQSPVGTVINAPYAAEDYFGSHAGMAILDTNGALFSRKSVYLYKLGTVAYGLENPVSVRQMSAVAVTAFNQSHAQLLEEKVNIWLRDVVGTPIVMNPAREQLQTGISRIILRGIRSLGN
jgi:hypothetical protein